MFCGSFWCVFLVGWVSWGVEWIDGFFCYLRIDFWLLSICFNCEELCYGILRLLEEFLKVVVDGWICFFKSFEIFLLLKRWGLVNC